MFIVFIMMFFEQILLYVVLNVLFLQTTTRWHYLRHAALVSHKWRRS